MFVPIHYGFDWSRYGLTREEVYETVFGWLADLPDQLEMNWSSTYGAWRRRNRELKPHRSPDSALQILRDENRYWIEERTQDNNFDIEFRFNLDSRHPPQIPRLFF